MSSNAGSLGDLQRAFQDYLLASSDTFQSAVRDTSKADRVTLLDVYRDGYALRLIEALTTDYPGVMAMAGPADFDRMGEMACGTTKTGLSVLCRNARAAKFEGAQTSSTHSYALVHCDGNSGSSHAQ